MAEKEEAVKAVVAEKDEAVFYRAEVMDYDILDEATLYNLPSVGTFNSTVLGCVVTTMGRLGFYTGANEFLYKGATPFTNSIFGVRYLFKRKGDFDNYDFTLVDEKNGVKLYENPYPLSIYTIRKICFPLDSSTIYRVSPGTIVQLSKSLLHFSPLPRITTGAEGETILDTVQM